ncbi:hypothetical protein GCM10009127_18990 [Alteraurantiacibacter aestuarii]|uniref:DUF481 domain-containing protein n=1 Tax=Alteraurantiacibacter aestuarii TaxID=650004 RepID=UPI0031CFD7FC
MKTRTFLFPLGVAALAATPAHAELPQPVRAMIEAAIATGDTATIDAVAGVARSTNPGDGAEIDAMLADFRAGQRELAAAQAQAEEVAIREASLLDNWSGEGQIGGFQSSGNTSSVGLTAKLDLEREGLDWTHKLRAAVDYRRNNGQTSREQLLLAYEPQYQIGDDMFLFGLAQFERDRFQGYSARYVASGGLGYQVVDNGSLKLAIKAGPAFRRTQLITGASENTLAALAGIDFGWTIADRLTLTQDVNAVAEAGGSALAIIDSKNTSLNFVTGLEAGISESLTARLSYTVEYDSNPPAGAVSTDTLTRFTLIYGF